MLLVVLVLGAAAHGTLTRPVWESGVLQPGQAFTHMFDNGTHGYHDGFSDANGTIAVSADGPDAVRVDIVRAEGIVRFAPADIEVAAGGRVTWHNGDDRLHSIRSDDLEEYTDGHREESPAGLLALAGVGAAVLLLRRR